MAASTEPVMEPMPPRTTMTTMKVAVQIDAPKKADYVLIYRNVKLAVVSEEKHVAYSPPARPAKNAEMTNVRIL